MYITKQKAEADAATCKCVHVFGLLEHWRYVLMVLEVPGFPQR